MNVEPILKGPGIPALPVAIAVTGLAVTGLLPLLQLGTGSGDIPRVALFLGRLHPVVLHLPIGLILLAIVEECLPSRRGTWLLTLAAASATLATLLGWMLSYSGGYDPELLHRHFYAGLATAAGANLALLLAALGRRGGSLRWAARLVLLATGGALGLAGHLGATITHGEDYLTEYAPDQLRVWLRLPVRIDPADMPWKPLPERAAFAEGVGPILNDRCVSCHSGQKAKGGLRLDTLDHVLKGGNGSATVTQGDPEKSLLIKYTDLPEDDDKHMPPKGKVQLTDGERAILAWWVKAGTPGDVKLGTLAPPPEIAAAFEASIPEAVRVKRETAMREKAAQLSTRLAQVRNGLPGSLSLVAPGDPRVEYSAGPDRAKVTDADLSRLAGLADSLTTLDLAGTHVTDSGLESSGTMPSLTRLELEKTAAGVDTTLRWADHFPGLEVLNVYGTPLGDTGLEALGRLPKLQRVYLWGTRVTVAGVEKLRKLNPRIEIIQAGPMPAAPANPTVPATSPAPRRT